MICRSPTISGSGVDPATDVTLHFSMDGVDMTQYAVNVKYNADPSVHNVTCQPAANDDEPYAEVQLVVQVC